MSEKKRVIAIITGGRSSYGIYKPVLKAIKKRDDLDYFLIVTCMYLMPEFKESLKEIKKDGFKIGAMVDMHWKEDNKKEQAKAIGHAIIGFTNVFILKKPDIVLIQGDRGESIAAAIVASRLGIPIAHMHGGEVSGNIDDSNRHAITKYANIHFPATEKSAERIKKIGENPKNIFLVGATGIDDIAKMLKKDKESCPICKHFITRHNKKGCQATDTQGYPCGCIEVENRHNIEYQAKGLMK